ncbi:MAG: GDP-fucose synthetase [Candidatus Moranbacteria bacterium RIFOXYC1_FULL_44_13]|nr:MAG: GDP-fucose synthetase [Candidatus Moranbacteria bacterium RIFOXYC1_FULL_44_13]OGI37886.1 MAG: GDP-fucose synthetase [Candidatus Moranbacteria bacterium RIFOXYD1_FULL_44_12]
MDKRSKIYVAGHTGLVGSAVTRQLKKTGYKNLILRIRKELDLLDQKRVEAFFGKEKPEYVFLAAAKVGGIMANKKYKGDFIYKNLQIQNNVIHYSLKYDVKKLLFMGASCIYPKNCPQPMKEEYLMTGPLEETSEAYSIAKIAGIKMCQSYNEQYGTNFISAIPANVYGPGCHFGLENSHVLSAMVRKFSEARERKEKKIIFWGTGTPRREFLYAADLAEALVYLMNKYDSSEPINIGTGKEISIKELANKIKNIVNFQGKIEWDKSKPDGTKRKLLDAKKINSLGWNSETSLDEGLEKTIAWYNIMHKIEKI